MGRALKLVTAAALSCGAFALFAIVAAAHTARYDSTVTISFQRGHHGESDEFSGMVISQKNRCQIHRRVVVRKRVDGADPAIGTDATNRDGRWEVKAALGKKAGTYYARARRKVLRRNANHLHVCKPAISDDVKAHGKP